MHKFFILILTLSVFLYANEADEIMKKVDTNLRGKNIYIKFTMNISSKYHNRSMKIESYSQGEKKSFVKILYPPKERGITFLSLNNNMWQYVPKIERIIKIPPSMMLQNWMGSNITNDDMVRQSSITDDYDAKIIKKEANIVTIELIPKEEATVVWGKIISSIDTSTYTSKKDIYYDEDNEIVRFFFYDKVKMFGDYFIPTYWRIEPADKTNNFTEIILEEVQYDIAISEQYFKKSALKRFSR